MWLLLELSNMLEAVIWPEGLSTNYEVLEGGGGRSFTLTKLLNRFKRSKIQKICVSLFMGKAIKVFVLGLTIIAQYKSKKFDIFPNFPQKTRLVYSSPSFSRLFMALIRSKTHKSSNKEKIYVWKGNNLFIFHDIGKTILSNRKNETF